MSKDRKQVRVAMLGRSRLVNSYGDYRTDEVGVKIQLLDADFARVGPTKVFGTPLRGKKASAMLRWSVGAVYEVDMTEDEQSVYPNSGLFIGWLPQDQLAELRALDKAEMALFQNLQDSQKPKDDDAWKEALRPIQQAYAKASFSARDVLLAQAVAFITRAPKD